LNSKGSTSLTRGQMFWEGSGRTDPVLVPSGWRFGKVLNLFLLCSATRGHGSLPCQRKHQAARAGGLPAGEVRCPFAFVSPELLEIGLYLEDSTGHLPVYFRLEVITLYLVPQDKHAGACVGEASCSSGPVGSELGMDPDDPDAQSSFTASSEPRHAGESVTGQ